MTEVKLLEQYSTPNPDELPVIAARGDHMEKSLIDEEGIDTAYEGIEKADEDDARKERLRKFIEQMLQRGHFGPFEHPRAFFAVEGISRDMMAQVTRHRVGFSFDVQSMRYVDFSDPDFNRPEDVEDATIKVENNRVEGEIPASFVLDNAYSLAASAYEDLLDAGLDKEDARKVLPIGTEVHMTFSANLRALMHVFDLRVSGAAQDDTRGFAQQVLEETRKWAPITVNEYEEHVKNASLNAP